MWIFKIVALWIMWGMGFWAGIYRGKLIERRVCEKLVKEADDVLMRHMEHCARCHETWSGIIDMIDEDDADD